MSMTDASQWQRLRQELTAAMKDGAEAALKRFYDEHFPVVYRYVLCRVAGDHSEAEEIVGDVFYQAFRDIEKYDAAHAPGAWLQGIARHRVLDALRRKGRRMELGAAGEAMSDRLADIEAGELPEAVLEREETAQLVERVLSELDPEYERVLRLRYLEDRPVKDVAEALAIAPKAAEARLFRARAAFRDAFRVAARGLNVEGIGAAHER